MCRIYTRSICLHAWTNAKRYVYTRPHVPVLWNTVTGQKFHKELANVCIRRRKEQRKFLQFRKKAKMVVSPPPGYIYVPAVLWRGPPSWLRNRRESVCSGEGKAKPETDGERGMESEAGREPVRLELRVTWGVGVGGEAGGRSSSRPRGATPRPGTPPPYHR